MSQKFSDKLLWKVDNIESEDKIIKTHNRKQQGKMVTEVKNMKGHKTVINGKRLFDIISTNGVLNEYSS